MLGVSARPIVGNEPFAVLLGDEVMVSTNQQPTAIAELADIALDHQCSSVAVMPVADRTRQVNTESLKLKLIRKSVSMSSRGSY